MATRFYLTQIAAGATPSSWSAGWNKTTGVGSDCALLPGGSGALSGSGAATGNSGTGTTGQYTAIRRWVSAPLAAQTISGTVKGQIICNTSLATNNDTVAIAIKVIQSGGSDRGTLLAVAASDNVSATPPEIATTDTNRQFLDASESASISLSSLSVSSGDRLVVEVGFYRQSTSVGTCSIVQFDNGQNADLPEDNTSTSTSLTPWVEFSGDLEFADPQYYDSASVPADNSAATNATATLTITPGKKSNMRAGDLVVALCQSRRSTTWSVGVDGGQTWTSETAVAVTSNIFVRAFWCTFNGTWTADPRFDSSDGTCTSAVLHVFRGKTLSDTWEQDVAQATTNHAAAATITRTGITTVADDVVALAAWFTADDNTWGTLTGSGWAVAGSAQYRNTSSTDQSSSYAYYIAPTGGTATGNTSKTQLTLGNDAATSWIMGFKDVTPVVAQSFIFDPFPFQPFLVR